jgi:hypothetical protein
VELDSTLSTPGGDKLRPYTILLSFSNKKDQRKSNGLKVFLVPLLLTPAELAVGLGSEVNPILPAKGGEEKFAPKNGSSVPPAKGGGIRRFIGDEYISKLFVVK